MNAKKTDSATEKGAAEALSAFLLKYRVVLLTVLAVLLVGILGTATYVTITQNMHRKGFTQLDLLESALTEANRDETAGAVEALAAKNARNPVGSRAYLLLGDIRFSQQNWTEAQTAYRAAAKANPKAYTAPVCLYNAAVCAEELGDIDGALALYGQAAAAPNFPLAPRALFSLGRLEDARNNYEKAVEYYDDTAAKFPSDNWANLAKSRALMLRSEGKAE